MIEEQTATLIDVRPKTIEDHTATGDLISIRMNYSTSN